MKKINSTEVQLQQLQTPNQSLDESQLQLIQGFQASIQEILTQTESLPQFTRPTKRAKFRSYPQDLVMPLSNPEVFWQNHKMKIEHVAHGQLIKNTLLEALGPNLKAILMQGSLMRGDGNPSTSDLDYIVILDQITVESISCMTNLKLSHPKNNFLYLSTSEYYQYPSDQKLQFHLTRQIYSDFDLGAFPYPHEIKSNLRANSIKLKDAIRPLLFELTNDNSSAILNRSHTIIKRVDDTVLRSFCYLQTGYFPLNRKQYGKFTNSELVQDLSQMISLWHVNPPKIHQIHNLLIRVDAVLTQLLSLS